MTKFLLLDYGATRIKAAVTDLENGSFAHIKDYPPPSNISKVKGHYEISLTRLKKQFHSICAYYFRKYSSDIQGIALCSQMHGFALLDNKNSPITNYISWQDERSKDPIKGKDSFSLAVNKVGNRFKKITGMKPRPGLPFFNLYHLSRAGILKSGHRIISLPDWLSLVSNDTNFIAHDTMIAGLGLQDIRSRKPSKLLLGFLKAGCKINTSAPEGSIAGYWHSNTRRIPIYVGVGDHQCAVLGAGNIPGKTISINLGTGSQVSIIDKKINSPAIEFRPYFGNSMLATVTHIPAGRALDKFLSLARRLFSLHNFDLWSTINKTTLQEIKRSDISFDLAFFASAWNYQGGGKISNITLDNFTLRNYLASLLRCFIFQYVKVVDLFDPNKKLRSCILSGGIARKIPVIQKAIKFYLNKKTIPSAKIDETLIGLRTLSLICSKRYSNYLAAQKVFRKTINDR